MDIDALAKQFSDFYYNTFDSDRTLLTNLYVPFPVPVPALLSSLPESLWLFSLRLLCLGCVVCSCVLFVRGGRV